MGRGRCRGVNIGKNVVVDHGSEILRRDERLRSLLV